MGIKKERNIQAMQNQSSKSSEKKANRILYIAIVGVLCISAAVAGIAVSMNQTAPEDSSSLPVNQTPTPDEDNNALPNFSSPVSGSVAKSHDLTTPVYSMTMQEYRVHRGVDITTSEGAVVYAVAKGTVKDVYKDPLMGWCVVLSHSGNAESLYANLSEEVQDSLTVGQTLEDQQIIGQVGSSALLELADEPHLHFEMTVGGVAVNPLDYIAISSSADVENEYEG